MNSMHPGLDLAPFHRWLPGYLHMLLTGKCLCVNSLNLCQDIYVLCTFVGLSICVCVCACVITHLHVQQHFIWLLLQLKLLHLTTITHVNVVRVYCDNTICVMFT